VDVVVAIPDIPAPDVIIVPSELIIVPSEITCADVTSLAFTRGKDRL